MVQQPAAGFGRFSLKRHESKGIAGMRPEALRSAQKQGAGESLRAQQSRPKSRETPVKGGGAAGSASQEPLRAPVDTEGASSLQQGGLKASRGAPGGEPPGALQER